MDPKPPPLAQFHKLFKIGFALAAGTMFLAAARQQRLALQAKQAQRDIRSSYLPAGFLDPTVLTPEGAKAGRLFWSSRAGAVRVLENPRLFDALFPGYGAAAGDRGLWSRYFEEIFDQEVYSPALMDGDPGHSSPVFNSWLGSLDVFRKYGGDVVIFGLSDSFVSVPAGLLRDDLNGLGIPALRDKKILQCSKGNMSPAALRGYLEPFGATGKKAEWAIWGFSVGLVSRTPYYDQMQRDIFAVLESWRAREAVSPLDRRFPQLSWSLFIGPGRQERVEKASEPFLVPDAIAADPRRLDDYQARHDDPNLYWRFDEKACDLSAISRETDQTIAQLLKISDKVLIFVPPTAPMTRRRMPPCLMPDLTAMLKSKAGARVVVEAPDWQALGLGYRDFVRPSEIAGLSEIDRNHVGESGARKVTAYLARWMGAAVKEEVAATAAAPEAGRIPGNFRPRPGGPADRPALPPPGR